MLRAKSSQATVMGSTFPDMNSANRTMEGCSKLRQFLRALRA
jgi:hypothetical protein